MRKRLAATLRRWAYRIEGHRPEHRAGPQMFIAAPYSADEALTRMAERIEQAVAVRRESRGWN